MQTMKAEYGNRQTGYTGRLEVGEIMHFQVMALPTWVDADGNHEPRYEAFDVHWAPRSDGKGDIPVICTETLEGISNDLRFVCRNVILSNGQPLHALKADMRFRVPIMHMSTTKADKTVVHVGQFEIYEMGRGIMQGTPNSKGMVGYLGTDGWGDFTAIGNEYMFQLECSKGSGGFSKTYLLTPCAKQPLLPEVHAAFAQAWETWMRELIAPTPTLVSILERLGLSDTLPAVQVRIASELSQIPVQSAVPSIPTAAVASPPSSAPQIPGAAYGAAAPPPPPYPAPSSLAAPSAVTVPSAVAPWKGLPTGSL